MPKISFFESRDRAIRKIASLALIAVAGVVLVSFALAANDSPAGAGKSPLYVSDPYTCPNGAGNTTVESGFVVLNTNGTGNLTATVSVKNGVPNATYDIWINQDPGGCPKPGPTGTVVTTNKQGNGTAQASEPRIAGATRFWVSATSGAVTLRSSAVTLD